MDRHSSTGVDRRNSTRYSTQNDGSDDEDYALAAMGISDGYRPTDLGHDRLAPQTSHAHERRTSNVHPYRELQSAPIPPPRPSSTTKPRNDFALRHDGAMGPTATRNATIASTSNALLSRASTVSTDIPLRAESPYQGPTGPSHPYQMYPQESRLARTASIATTSTAPLQERSYAGPSRPAHPYGMYPQNIVSETENDEPAVPAVPVGFSGLNNNYQRRLGPEGEEIADIIGPDGHTEQLPPYSQYPDEAFARKARLMVQLPAPVSGAGGIGLATRDPEFASQEDLNSPESQLSSSNLTLADSNSQVNTPAAAVSEKPPLKKWQRFGKRKVCGIIPMWAIILAAFVVIMFGVVLGSILAALKPKHPPKHNHNVGGDGDPQSVVYTTLTTTFDATPFTTVPSGISALPTGVYALPISTPSTQQQGCIQDTTQSSAWSCNLPMALPYQLDVDFIPGSSSLADNELTLNYGNFTIDFLPYGAQPPILSQAQVLGLVTDSQDPKRGPAWFFQVPYNKVVILPGEALAAPTSNSKRQYNSHNNPQPGAFMRQKGVAQPGDTPWFCYWNGTLLEGFIYVNQISGWGRSSTTSSSYTTTVTSTGSYSQSATGTYSQSAQNSSAQSSGYGNPNFLPGYPKVVKLEERRIPAGAQAIPPYCVQHVVHGDGTTQPAMNSTNQPITLYLNETEPSTVYPISDRSVTTLFDRLEERDTYLRERDSSTSCGCVWIST